MSHGPLACIRCGAIKCELGLEPTPTLYVQHIVQVSREVHRVLRDDGIFFLNIGDCYFGDSPVRTSGVEAFEKTWDRTQTRSRGGKRRSAASVDGLKPKDLCMIPARLALALQADGWFLRADIIWAKGVSGQREIVAQVADALGAEGIADDVAARVIAHLDPFVGNPMPDSTEDRPTKSDEHILMLSKSRSYFFDGIAVREEASSSSLARIAQKTFDAQKGGMKDFALTVRPDRSARTALENFRENPGRNIRSVWTIPTSAYKDAHFAVFPPAIPDVCVRMGTSERGACPTCGSPWERVVERRVPNDPGRGEDSKLKNNQGSLSEIAHLTAQRRLGQAYQDQSEAPRTVGWMPSCSCYRTSPLPEYPEEPGCAAHPAKYHEQEDFDDSDCDDYGTRRKVRGAWRRSLKLTPEPEVLPQDIAYEREVERVRPERERLLADWASLLVVPCVVLDPFAGSGTTGMVAKNLGRSATLIEINPFYAELIRKRLGERLEVRAEWQGAFAPEPEKTQPPHASETQVPGA